MDSNLKNLNILRLFESQVSVLLRAEIFYKLCAKGSHIFIHLQQQHPRTTSYNWHQKE